MPAPKLSRRLSGITRSSSRDLLESDVWSRSRNDRFATQTIRSRHPRPIHRNPLTHRVIRANIHPSKLHNRGHVMGEFISQILKGTPAWVWAILVALVVLGVRQLRPRVVTRYSVLIAPVVFLFIGLMSAGRGPIAFAVWALTLIACAGVTFFVWQPTGGARYDATSDRLHLPGSVLPMLLMLSIFLLNYAINVALAIKPALRAELSWQVGPAIILGALSGLFIGRAATLFRMNRPPQTALVA